MPKYRTAPLRINSMPPGIPNIVGNEAAERFSFYGMRGILVAFMVGYLHLMGNVLGEQLTDPQARERFHNFVGWVYFFPIIGAFLSDAILGKYRTIIYLSIVYCLGHLCLALMGANLFGMEFEAETMLNWGLMLIAIGSGGIKPCVSAHVGDQFGKTNAHLITKIFNYFYFSINVGALIAHLMTPWVLKHYGPHWAFGIPGVLMALATVFFWMGRNKFAHVPASGLGSLAAFFKTREGKLSLVGLLVVPLLGVAIWVLFFHGNPISMTGLVVYLKWLAVYFIIVIYSWAQCGPVGIISILKLSIIYLFILVFWALFDQTGSSWILQAGDMDRDFFGWEILPSQMQFINPLLVLIFIPLFTQVLYPAIDKVWKLTPLRKISIGLFLMTLAFALTAVVQGWIDAGNQPHFGWQLLAYVILTASEIMVSIVALEFSYTQAPNALKSVVMGAFFLSVSFGNKLTEIVNHSIQVPNPIAEADTKYKELGPDAEKKDFVKIRFAGFDGKENTEDDIVVTFRKGGVRHRIDFQGVEIIEEAQKRIKEATKANGKRVPSPEDAKKLLADLRDPWGNELVYTRFTRLKARVSSMGPDKKNLTQWDQGAIVEEKLEDEDEKKPWAEKRRKLLQAKEPEKIEGGNSVFVGGQSTLEGAAYFWFFTALMGVSAVLFIFVVIFYRTQEFLHDEVPEEQVEDEALSH